MTNTLSLFKSSIFKKWIVGATGLGLSFFVLIHMSGNMLLWQGAESYNLYAHGIISNPFLEVGEILLLLAFILHVALAISLARQNRMARPLSPKMRATLEKDARFASRSMIYTGLVVLVFTILHLKTFKYGPNYEVTYHGVTMRDLHRLVVEKFQEPLYIIWYFSALVVLGIHLSHGASALFQSLGIATVRNVYLKRIGWLFALVIAAGFISQPIYAFYFAGK